MNKEVVKARATEKARIFNMKVVQWYIAVLKGLMILTNASVLRFQNGNKKLKDGNGIAFIIFSLPAVLTCPNATVHCMKACYARRDERNMSARIGRIINLLISKRDDFESILYDAIHNAIYTRKGELRNRFKNNEIVFRVHESGDFYSERYMRIWFKVAAKFPNVTFFAYTKSFAMYERCMSEKPENFEVRASVWDDTTVEEIGTIARCGMSIYTAYDEQDMEKALRAGVKECKCDSCTACGCACARQENDTIGTRIH